MENENILIIKDLDVRLFTDRGELPVIDRLSLTLKAGETLGIVGESGCGKSMLASAIMGLIAHPGKVTGGSIQFEGQELAGMKKTAFLINTARGSIIDEEALIKALEEKQIAGAALDVTREEPFSRENPLLEMDNVLTAPHIGAATKEASSRSSLACAEGIDDFLSGRTPKYPVPPMREQLEQMNFTK